MCLSILIHFSLTVKPFANEEEYKKTEEIVRIFQNGIGAKLHQKLLERAKGKRNWVFIFILYLKLNQLMVYK